MFKAIHYKYKKPLVTMVSRLDTQVRIKVHHKGDIGFKDKRHGYYYQWFY